MTTGPRRRHPPPPSCTNESLRLVGGFFWPSNDTGIHHRDPPPPPRQTVTTNSMNHPPPPTSLHDSLVGSFGFPSRMPASATTNESSRLVGGFLWLSTEDASIRHHQRVLMTRWWFHLAIQRARDGHLSRPYVCFFFFFHFIFTNVYLDDIQGLAFATSRQHKDNQNR